MKVSVDTNVLISFLMAPDSPKAPARIVRAAVAGEFEFILAQTTVLEMHDKATTKPYLIERIPGRRLALFQEALQQIAEIVPIVGPIPRVTRDPRDDYLLAPELVGRIDYLVSGDKDLHAIEDRVDVTILTPAEFVAILDASAGR